MRRQFAHRELACGLFDAISKTIQGLRLRRRRQSRLWLWPQMIEALELRWMLAVFDGTSGPDDIFISAVNNVMRVQINGVDQTVSDPKIVVNTLEGDDDILVGGLLSNTDVDVFGGDGDDAMSCGVLHSGHPTTFDGGLGSDIVFASNTFDQNSNVEITINEFQIYRFGVPMVQYEHIESLHYDDSDLGNRIGFEGLRGDVSPFPSQGIDEVVIAGHGGDDFIVNRGFFGDGGVLAMDVANDELFISGGDGVDTLSLDDSATSASTCVIGSVNMIFVAEGVSGGLFYSGIDQISLLGTAGDDEVDLFAQQPTCKVFVETVDGNDTVNVAGGDFDNGGFSVVNTSIIAGNGNDSIVFDDHLDGPGETESYIFDNFRLSKGIFGITYSAFESQTLRAADGGAAPFVPSTININAISGQIESTTIIGGTNRTNTVNIGNGNLVNVSGSQDVQLGAAGGTINFNDQNATAARTYALGATAMTSPPVSFSGAGAVNLNAGAGADSISITSSALATPLTVNGGGGNDTVSLGAGNFANLAGNVSVNGGAGIDSVRYLDDSSTSLDSATLTTAALVTGGRTHSYSAVEHVAINTGSAGSIISLDSVSVQTTVNGGAGDDVVSIGGGSLKNNLGANVVVNGGAGTDSMNLLGQNDTGKNSYTFTSFTEFRFGDSSTGKFVTFGGIEQATLRCGGGDDTIDVTIASVPLHIFGNAGNDVISVSQSTVPVSVDTGTSRPETVFGGSAGDSLTVGFVQGFPATVVLESNATIGRLSVVRDSTLRIGPGAVLNRIRPALIDFGLSLGGVIDLAGGALLWRGDTATPDFRTFLTRGYSAGAWNGTSTEGAINSSLAASTPPSDAVGYGLGSQIGISSIGPFAIAAGDTLLRYTLEGDANLDRKVDLTDFTVLASNFNGSNKVWAQADSNYSNGVDLTDFTMLAARFNQQLSGPAAAAPSSHLRIDSVFDDFIDATENGTLI